MEKQRYGTFRLGQRGRRGRRRYDPRWTQVLMTTAAIRRTGRTNVWTTANSDVNLGAVLPQLSSEVATSSLQLDQPETEPTDVNPLPPEGPLQLQDPDEPMPEESHYDELNPEDWSDTEHAPSPLECGEATTQTGHSTAEESQDLSISAGFRSQLNKIFRWESILAIILLNGTGRLSVEQYDLIAVLINFSMQMSSSRSTLLPASRTIGRTVQPILERWGFAESHIYTVASSSSNGDVSRVDTTLQPPQQLPNSFIVVPPSAWSRLDVSFKPTWDVLKASASRTPNSMYDPAFSVIQSIPMVAEKDHILDLAQAIVPTKLAATGSQTPSLLTQRNRSPHITLHLKAFPSSLRDAINKNSNAVKSTEIHNGVCTTTLRCHSVKSFLVCAGETEEEISPSLVAGGKEDMLAGRIPALHKPIRNLSKAGDVCSILEVTDNGVFDSMFILLQQHLRRNGEQQEMHLFHVPLHQSPGEDDTYQIRFDRAHRFLVSEICTDIPERVSRNSEKLTMMAPFGRLKDGRLFFVDHILLYSDGFSQYNFKKGSAGGIYALSLNYPAELRRSRERVRVIALTPPSISTVQGLRAVLDDIVKSSTEGVVVRNADNEDMVLFTNVVGYIADYHETGHLLDITGQNGKAPCHLCAFLRHRGHPSTASQYGYSTLIHSSDTCFAHMGERSDFVRASNPSDEELVDVGLNSKDRALMKNSPKLELWRKLKAAMEGKTIPLTEHDLPVVNPKFDPYRSVLVGPDHVLFGIAVNALNFAFSMLPSRSRRTQVDQMISASLRLNGLAKEENIFNEKLSAVHAASISVRFCTLLVSPEIFKEVLFNCNRLGETSRATHVALSASIENLTRLRDLVSATYWYPNLSIDGPDAVAKFNSNDGREYLRSLEVMCEEYIRGINYICKTIQHAAVELDKPNVHRMLELYKHSIPCMGHVRNFAELVFETAHQPLKRAMLRSNFRESHLQSSRTCIAEDWSRRLECILHSPAVPVDEEEEWREKELIKLLCGRRQDVVNAVSSDKDLMHRLKRTVRSESLQLALNAKPSKLHCSVSFSRWVLSKPLEVTDNEPDLMSSLSEIKTLALKLMVEEGQKEIRTFARASRVKFTVTGGRLRPIKPKSHDWLERDTVLRAWVEDGHEQVVIPSKPEGMCKAHTEHFVVDMLVNFGAGRVHDYHSRVQSYAAVRVCQRTEGDLLQVKPRAPLQLLALDDRVRRVAIVHACETDGRIKCLSLRIQSLSAMDPCCGVRDSISLEGIAVILPEWRKIN